MKNPRPMNSGGDACRTSRTNFLKKAAAAETLSTQVQKEYEAQVDELQGTASTGSGSAAAAPDSDESSTSDETVENEEGTRKARLGREGGEKEEGTRKARLGREEGENRDEGENRVEGENREEGENEEGTREDHDGGNGKGASEKRRSEDSSDLDKPLRRQVSLAVCREDGSQPLTVGPITPQPAMDDSIHRPTAAACQRVRDTLQCPRCAVVGKMGLAGSSNLQRRMHCTSCKSTTTGAPLQRLVAREESRIAWCQSKGIAPDGIPRMEQPTLDLGPRLLSDPTPAAPSPKHSALTPATTSLLEARLASLEELVAETRRELCRTEAARVSGAQEVTALRAELRAERTARQKVEHKFAQFALGETDGVRRAGHRSYAAAVTGTASSPSTPISILRPVSRVARGETSGGESRSGRAENVSAGKAGKISIAEKTREKNSASEKSDGGNSTGEKRAPAKNVGREKDAAAAEPSRADAKRVRELAKLRDLLASRRTASRQNRGKPRSREAPAKMGLVGIYVRGIPQGPVGPLRRQIQRSLGEKCHGTVPNMSLFGSSMAEIVCRRDKAAELKIVLQQRIGLHVMDDDYVPYEGDGPGVREACQACWRKLSARGDPSEKNVPNWACRQWYSSQLRLLQDPGPVPETPEPAASAAEGAGKH